MPNTKDWYAWIDMQPGPGEPPRLIVAGQVAIGNSAGVPVLVKRLQQDADENVLLLDLAVRSSGVAGMAEIAFRHARYEEAVPRPDRYREVEIAREGKRVALLDVSVTP